jgi:hypothetical protein
LMGTIQVNVMTIRAGRVHLARMSSPHLDLANDGPRHRGYKPSGELDHGASLTG